MILKKKKFDCVEMKRKGAERIYQITKDMTVEEKVEYWRKRTEEMNARIKKWHTQHDRSAMGRKNSPDKAILSDRSVGIGA